MTETVADLAPLKPNAKRQFAALWGAPLVLNSWLLAACGLLSLLVLVLAGTVWHVTTRLSAVKPLVVRIDAVGRAEAVEYDAATWTPERPELRYFLTRFVTLHFARIRATIARDYPDSLLFLESRLSNARLAETGRNSPVETFLSDLGQAELDVEVQNVTFADLSTPPYRASVDFSTRGVGERARLTPPAAFTAQIAFVLRDSVPNAFIRVNPLGLQITQLRIDEAFAQTRRE